MTAARKSNPQPSKDTSQTYLIVLKRRLEPPRSAGRSCGHRSAFKFHRRGGYDFRPWPPEKGRPHREPVTHPDDWAVCVEIGSRVTVERTTLWQRLMLKGWMPEAVRGGPRPAARHRRDRLRRVLPETPAKV